MIYRRTRRQDFVLSFLSTFSVFGEQPRRKSKKIVQASTYRKYPQAHRAKHVHPA